MVPDYQGKRFKSVTRGGADLDKIAGAGGSAAGENETKAAETPGLDALIAFVKLTLKDQVKDVRGSARLTSRPVCRVADGGEPDMQDRTSGGVGRGGGGRIGSGGPQSRKR